jgi:hypothetical protein
MLTQTRIPDLLIEAGADSTVPSGLFFSTVGVAAAWGGAEEHICKSLSTCASFVAKDTMGRQPLHPAALRGNMVMFTAILNASDEHGDKDNCGRSVVIWAVQGGSIEIFEKALELLRDEAIYELDTTGWTPLCWAARGIGTRSRPVGYTRQQENSQSSSKEEPTEPSSIQ